MTSLRSVLVRLSEVVKAFSDSARAAALEARRAKAKGKAEGISPVAAATQMKEQQVSDATHQGGAPKETMQQREARVNAAIDDYFTGGTKEESPKVESLLGKNGSFTLTKELSLGSSKDPGITSFKFSPGSKVNVFVQPGLRGDTLVMFKSGSASTGWQSFSSPKDAQKHLDLYFAKN